MAKQIVRTVNSRDIRIEVGDATIIVRRANRRGKGTKKTTVRYEGLEQFLVKPIDNQNRE